MSLLLGIISGAIGGMLSARFWARWQVQWSKKRDAAAEAYEAVLAFDTVLRAAVALAIRIHREAKANNMRTVAESADWHMQTTLEASRSRLDRVTRALWSLEATWGPAIAGIFRRYHAVASGWHNFFAKYRDDIHGHVDPNDDDDLWSPDETGYDWYRVIAPTQPDAGEFVAELDALMELIQRFARSAGVAPAGLRLSLDAQQVVDEFEERENRRLSAPATTQSLPPAR